MHNDAFAAYARAHKEAPEAEAGAAPFSLLATGEIEWGCPIDFLADDTMGAPELRPEHIPTALHGFARDTAGRMGVDPAAVALAALVACASVVTDEWRIQPKEHDDTWTESPRIWGAIVGDPSILKSPVLAAATRPIDKLEAAARTRWNEDLARHKAEHEAWKRDKGAPCDEPRAPRLKRWLVEGTTVEAISEALRTDGDAKMDAPAGKLLIRQDELSEWVASFDKYRSGGSGGSDRGAYLRLYNGGRYTIDRVGRGSFAIPNWSACVLGGIQPEPIRKMAQNAAEDGLLQRFIYCVPARQEPGEDRKPDHAALARYSDLLACLSALTPGSGRGDHSAPVVLHTEAHAHRRDVDQLVRVLSALPDTSNRLRAAYGKIPGLYARLTLLFHLIEIADARSRGADGPHPAVIPEATARRSAAYLEEIVLPHLARADAVMFATTQTGHARWIAGYIMAQGKPRVTLRDIVLAYKPLRAPDARRTLLDVLESLVTMGWLYPEDPPSPTRPPAAWLVNPAVLTAFADRGAAERERRKRVQADMAELIRRKGKGERY